jgi:hypothetical protein
MWERLAEIVGGMLFVVGMPAAVLTIILVVK